MSKQIGYFILHFQKNNNLSPPPKANEDILLVKINTGQNGFGKRRRNPPKADEDPPQKKTY